MAIESFWLGLLLKTLALFGLFSPINLFFNALNTLPYFLVLEALSLTKKLIFDRLSSLSFFSLLARIISLKLMDLSREVEVELL
jgi:hypothetical protein